MRVTRTLTNKDWVTSFMNSGMDDITIPTHLADYEVVLGSGRSVVSFLKKVTDIRDATTEIGIIQIDLNYSQLKNIIESINTDEESLFYIIDSNDRIIYFPDERYLGGDIDQETRSVECSSRLVWDADRLWKNLKHPAKILLVMKTGYYC